MSILTRISGWLRRKPKYKYTVYYLPETASEYVDKQLFKHGLQACPHYDCDFYRFDLASGVILCRRRISKSAKTGSSYKHIEDCNEFAFPSKFFMAAIQHYGLGGKHVIQMKNEKNMRREAEEAANAPAPTVDDVSFS